MQEVFTSMRTRMRRCPKCGSYTFSDSCSRCNLPTRNPLPPRYSPQDKYAAYRRRYRDECK